jgi:hypothetical protein
MFTSRSHFSIENRWSDLEGDFSSIEKAGGEIAMNMPNPPLAANTPFHIFFCFRRKLGLLQVFITRWNSRKKKTRVIFQD